MRKRQAVFQRLAMRERKKDKVRPADVAALASNHFSVITVTFVTDEDGCRALFSLPAKPSRSMFSASLQ